MGSVSVGRGEVGRGVIGETLLSSLPASDQSVSGVRRAGLDSLSAIFLEMVPSLTVKLQRVVLES